MDKIMEDLSLFKINSDEEIEEKYKEFLIDGFKYIFKPININYNINTSRGKYMNWDNQDKDPWGGKNDAPDFDDLLKNFHLC